MNTRTRRPVLRLTAGVCCVLFTLTACSASKPDRGALRAKLKTEGKLSALSDPQLDCFTDVINKYSDAGDLNDYVDGKTKLDDIRGRGSGEQAAKDESAACGTK